MSAYDSYKTGPENLLSHLAALDRQCENALDAYRNALAERSAVLQVLAERAVALTVQTDEYASVEPDTDMLETVLIPGLEQFISNAA